MNTVVMSAPSVATSTLEAWHLSSGSHLAVAVDRHRVAVPVPIRRGRFELDRDGGIGTLDVELGVAGGGSLRGQATRGEVDEHGGVVWAVDAILTIASQSGPMLLTLRDHGVVHSSIRWWWLSGVGRTAGRRRAVAQGSPLVADLLFTR